MNEIEQYEISKWYTEFCTELLQFNFPELLISEIQEAITYSIQKRGVNTALKVDNNYSNKELDSTIFDLLDYIIKCEPILTPYGVMFKKHDEEKNPLNDMIQGFLRGRKLEKKEMFKYPKGSELFEKHNLLQLLLKIDAKP